MKCIYVYLLCCSFFFAYADVTKSQIRCVVHVEKDQVVQHIYFTQKMHRNILRSRYFRQNYTDCTQFYKNISTISINDELLILKELSYEKTAEDVHVVLVYPNNTVSQKIQLCWKVFPVDILEHPLRSKWQMPQLEFSSNILPKKTLVQSEEDIYVIAKVLHAAPYEAVLSKKNNTLTWKPKYISYPQNFQVEMIYEMTSISLKWLIVMIFLVFRKKKLVFIGLVFCLLPITIIEIPISKYQVEKPISVEQKQKIFRALLHNIYGSFSYQDKEDLYDALSFSTTGNMLEQIYLEAYQSLFFDPENTFIIDNVAIERIDIIELDSGSFEAKATWQVRGWAVHMGHKHLRTNEYLAVYTTKNINGFWKMVTCKVLKQIRL